MGKNIFVSYSRHEVGFIDDLVRNLEQQGRLAEAIAVGVRGYFAQYPPDGTRFKQERRSTLASASEAAGGTP